MLLGSLPAAPRPVLKGPLSTKCVDRPLHGLSTTVPKRSIHAVCKALGDGSKPTGELLKKVGTCAAAMAVAVGLMASTVQLPASAITTQQILFLEAWRAVDRAYVDKGFNGQSWFRVREQYLKSVPMDNKQQTYDAITQLLASLDDPFTRFLTPDRLTALRRGTSGSVTGVGVEVTYPDQQSKDANLRVVTPLPGGPAEAAGIKAGDAIVAIDGKPTQGLSIYEASDLLLGEVGSEVTLTVRHPGGSDLQVPLTREKLTINPVSYTSCPRVAPAVGPPGASGSLGYIRLATFNGNTAAAFKDALVSLRKQGVDRIVLDIRNNGGGLFPAGVEVARSLINTGEIVLIADANGVRDIYSADGLALDPSTPLAVLVNKGTASASEVLAGALQDSRRATIVGESQTFGKGLIQTVVDLSDGSGVAVTVARYQTPSGTDINKIGITPDIRITPESLPIGHTSSDNAFCRVLEDPASAPRLFK